MSRKGRYLFTSESVTEGHPDKIADQISDSILDAILAQDPTSRVACETLITTGLCLVAGEITTNAYVDVQKLVRETIRGVGYTDSEHGFDCDTCGRLWIVFAEFSMKIVAGLSDESARTTRAWMSKSIADSCRSHTTSHCRSPVSSASPPTSGKTW